MIVVMKILYNINIKVEKNRWKKKNIEGKKKVFWIINHLYLSFMNVIINFCATKYIFLFISINNIKNNKESYYNSGDSNSYYLLIISERTLWQKMEIICSK